MLGNTITASIYVRGGQKIAFDDAKTGAQSRKSHNNMDAVGSDPMKSVAAIPCIVHPTKSETSAAASFGGGSTNTPEAMQVSDNAPLR